MTEKNDGNDRNDLLDFLMSDFLGSFEHRPLQLDSKAGLEPLGLVLGEGSHGLEVAIAQAGSRPTAVDLRATWKARHGGRAAPVILVVLHDGRASVCGPSGDPVPVYHDLDRDQAERLCRAALEMPDRHAARRFLRSALPETASPIPGLRNEGLLATHELEVGVPRRPDWDAARTRARGVMSHTGRDLLREMGYTLEPLPGSGSILLAEDGTHTGLAVFLEQGESVEVAGARFANQSPISYALGHADRRNVPWVVVSAGRMLRLYPVRPGTGVASRGRTETFVQVHLDLLRDSEAGYLWLLFSPDALRESGSLHEILESSADFATDLRGRLRERIYDEVVPHLATAIGRAQELEAASQEDLDRTYEMALFLLFRLLFIAYGEDRHLLPYDTNEAYRSRSLKKKAHELLALRREDRDFDDSPSHWNDIHALFRAVREGKGEWDVPPYDGTLFASDATISPIGAALERVELSNREFGPALSSLLLDEGPEGLGPVDFRSLSVREFGTVYEGLLESELSLAERSLTLDDEGNYIPADEGDEVRVEAGEFYPHDASGRRKSTGTYYTKTFVVEHLLEHSLEPALECHLERLDGMDDVEAAERFFDFRIADIAMGSGHFLVTAIDHIEQKFSGYLLTRPLPGVQNELERLREKAAEALHDPGAKEEIESAQLLRRQIARRCVYGVDINPIAVHLARLSLWIHTFVRGLPLSFLDHGLIEGNSLLGIATMKEAREALGHEEGEQISEWDQLSDDLIDRAAGAVDRLGTLSDADAAEIRRAREAQREIEEREAPVAALFDVLTAARVDSDVRAAVEERVKEGVVSHWVVEPEEVMGSDLHRMAREALGELEPFHFPLRFPEVFRPSRGGFDVIVGNPPWEEATLEEDDFWTRYRAGLQALSQREQETIKERFRRERPDLVERFEEEKRRADRMRAVLTSGAFPGMGTGDPDLYKAFCWRFWNLARRDGGWIGVVLPRSAFAARGSQEFRRTILDEDRLEDLTLLLNNRQWVFEDVHPQYTISLVSICRDVPEEDRVLHLRGPYRSRERFEHGKEIPPVRFVSEEVLEWTDTAALPLLPSEDSAEVFARIREAPRLDLDDGESWRARPYAELHATNDKKRMDLSDDPPDGFWPVFKGESFDLWTPDTGTYYAWADPESMIPYLQQKRERGARRSNSPFYEFPKKWVEDPDTLPCLSARIAFRDVTNRTNRRTAITALLPPNAFITNKGPYFLWPRGDERDEAYLLAILSSIPYDWYMRRFVETTLNYHILNPSPIPRPGRESPLWTRVIELAGRLAAVDERYADWAAAVGVGIGTLTGEDREQAIFELDAIAARLYRLSEPQLIHVFETFHEGWDFTARLEAVLDHYRRLEK